MTQNKLQLWSYDERICSLVIVDMLLDMETVIVPPRPINTGANFLKLIFPMNNNDESYCFDTRSILIANSKCKAYD